MKARASLTAILLAIFLSSALYPAQALVKPGWACTKIGKTATTNGKKYTCVKSKGKLLWNKGVLVKKAAPKVSPSPSPKPSKSPAPSPSPSATSANSLSHSPSATPVTSLSPSPLATPTSISPAPTSSFATPVQPSSSGATPSGTTSNTCETGTGVCAIGDKGPGGGRVFYLQNGTSYGSWKYLEVAPPAWNGEIDPMLPWCPSSLPTLGTGLQIGSGNANTLLITSQCGEAKFGDAVGAKMAASYRGGGKSDWYLPSKNELLLLFQNINNFGQVSANMQYWSSSQDSLSRSWAVDLTTGASSSDQNMIDRSIRPIRAFG